MSVLKDEGNLILQHPLKNISFKGIFKTKNSVKPSHSSCFCLHKLIASHSLSMLFQLSTAITFFQLSFQTTGLPTNDETSEICTEFITLSFINSWFFATVTLFFPAAYTDKKPNSTLG